MRKLTTVLVLPLAVLAVLGFAGCGSSSSPTAKPTSTTAKAKSPAANVKVKVSKLPDLGPVLVDSKDMTLYVFAPDQAKSVTCTGSCAAAWPPMKLTNGQKPVAASAKLRKSLLGSDEDPEGGKVVTYAGWPLYTYVADTAGTANGQAIDVNGGYWYVITPAGKVIK